MHRRAFLAAATLTTACTPASPYRSLSLAEARTLAALCDLIVPKDDFPSASQSGVVRFIDRQLARHFLPHRAAYRQGIRELDQLAGGDFSSLPADRQQGLAEELDRGKSPFFTLVVTHTLQGYYASPRYGANKDFVAWQMLGVPVSPSRGRA
ncbi:MAG: gluconate 2-dehydrogenase subunit 3 family protein [Bryobacterales bacterium]|nr:gluconate 2-dehydrogenase subunit 3 family protein [Bryobacterales bacterium]